MPTFDPSANAVKSTFQIDRELFYITNPCHQRAEIDMVSCLDYTKSFLTDGSASICAPLWSVERSAARGILLKHKLDPITLCLKSSSGFSSELEETSRFCVAWSCYLWLLASPGSLLVLKTLRIFALALLSACGACPSDICMVGSQCHASMWGFKRRSHICISLNLACAEDSCGRCLISSTALWHGCC